jgi:hypothetical protein
MPSDLGNSSASTSPINSHVTSGFPRIERSIPHREKACSVHKRFRQPNAVVRKGSLTSNKHFRVGVSSNLLVKANKSKYESDCLGHFLRFVNSDVVRFM